MRQVPQNSDKKLSKFHQNENVNMPQFVGNKFRKREIKKKVNYIISFREQSDDVLAAILSPAAIAAGSKLKASRPLVSLPPLAKPLARPIPTTVLNSTPYGVPPAKNDSLPGVMQSTEVLWVANTVRVSR